VIKLFDDRFEEKIPVGFEMLVNNFSAGIIAMLLALLGNVVIGPVVVSISNAFGAVVDAMIRARLLPLAAIIIEPAKILFLNNALNHGVLTPLGVAAAEQSGRAIHFLLETNPGPGLGQ
jgi:PTS system mannitol-specific IIC component